MFCVRSKIGVQIITSAVPIFVSDEKLKRAEIHISYYLVIVNTFVIFVAFIELLSNNYNFILYFKSY